MENCPCRDEYDTIGAGNRQSIPYQSSTFAAGEDSPELWRALFNLTELVYKELGESSAPVTKEMLYEYYKDLR